MPEVTVLLPVYNGANYLRESIDSVLKQTYRDFELHILDDGSNDATPQIAQGTGDPRVRYSKNEGRFGLFKTLNRGFDEAASSLVRIWAHDDRMLPVCLENFVAFAREHPEAGMIYCDFFAIDANAKRTGAETCYQGQRQRTPDLAEPLISALLFFYYGCLPGNISTVLLRREAWKKTAGFLTGIQQAPDYDMWTRVSEQYPIGFLREKLIELREHPLQLGKLGHKQMTSIDEELPVIIALKRRMEGVVSDTEFWHYWRCERGRQQMHWIMRALLRMDWRSACRGWQAVRAYGHRQCWSQAWFWFSSANGRLFMPNRDALFDAKKTLVTDQ